MRCHICDKQLSDKEVVFNKDLDEYEPCTTCLDIAMDAAYCDGFQVEEDDVGGVNSNFDGGDAGDMVLRWREHYE